MKVFTIETETNNITLHSSVAEADAVANAVSFRNEAGLTKLAADWPVARLIEIWNSLPGVTPVKKFTSRNVAIGRIWAAIQNLGEPAPAAADVALPTPEATPTRPDVAPAASDAAPAKAKARKKPAAPKRPTVATEGRKSREGSKTESVLALLRREGGVTGEELMSATGWQAHSVRGFLSGTIRKKMGLQLLSTKTEDGERRYSLSA